MPVRPLKYRPEYHPDKLIELDLLVSAAMDYAEMYGQEARS
jgi:hypothetical protein